MSKHTPGPWYVAENENAVEHYIYPEKVTPTDTTKGEYPMGAGFPFRPIAKVFVEKPDFTSANARLIAAAPELLRALKLCADRLEYDSKWNKETLGFVHKIIAKAEGREE